MSTAESLITRSIHASARYLDDQDFTGFLSLFQDNGEYLIVVKAPELSTPMTWMQRSKGELAERLEAVAKHEWEIVQAEQTRLVSVDKLEFDSDQAISSSSFVVYQTDSEGRSACYAVGRYDDTWKLLDRNWLLERRQVNLKTRMLSMLTPIPV